LDEICETIEVSASSSNKSRQQEVDRILDAYKPSLIISVERPGKSSDGNYYNMRKKNISKNIADIDLFFMQQKIPSIGIGDGGNEIGMGNVHNDLLNLDIIPSVTKCDELVISSVSNWGVYGIISEMSITLGRDLFTLFDPVEITDYLLSKGAVDGVTGLAEPTEDGFSLDVGLNIINELIFL